ncbi:MAG: excinuclease ABC subunit UvrA [Planctomycetales bacterium]|nr:excinuclease ABC subunit UvrA [Planctomycetales bacterium]NIM09388.1 excinuclease ABC subunit UvrA [Planctomycetales bacterium]NIN08858.1 excinuclease ABC subunit UvrA [Planctomycetales bacterium]NIN77975.1 excinuclease ABC subunit UvrA [Planctomycetales bacterium]NIO35158.1 excinuclease ABC subunit UvrA [Planctomycetales bacterium]
MGTGSIRLRGVSVHNLQHVDLDLPHKQLIAFCGLSGSGKTSLAVDTLYAEGQRRYIESFSPYTRQFLERLEKPAAERIDGIPASVAVTRRQTGQSRRSTVGTATDITDYLRLLVAKIGRVICRQCQQRVQRDSPQSVSEFLDRLPPRARFLIAFAYPLSPQGNGPQAAAALREDGFVRVICQDRLVHLDREPLTATGSDSVWVVVDRLRAGAEPRRTRDSLETAFTKGGGRCCVVVEDTGALQGGGQPRILDGQTWQQFGFSQVMRCEDCEMDYAPLEPQLFSFNHPLGACRTCEGFGNTIEVDMDLVVPDRKKTLRAGAIAPWNTPAYAHELDELIALADDFHIPLDVPFEQLTDQHLRLLNEGVPERDFGGLNGFFRWLERRKYKMHLRVFLSRWRSHRPCPDCHGARLNPAALAVRVGGKNIAEISSLRIDQCRWFMHDLPLDVTESELAKTILEEIQSRLSYLETVGLHYLTLDRTLPTLSGGEARRVALSSALGSSLVNMLYVLDEPSIGLHPRDMQPLVAAICGLRDRGNTVIVVEHDDTILRAADQVVELGPGAGEQGGRVTFQGTPEEIMLEESGSITGDYLAGRRGIGGPVKRREPQRGWVRLSGARGHNLKNVTVEFPLGLFCVVTGVSGAGKSTLVQDTLYPALCRRLRKDAPKPLDFDDIYGDGQIDDCILVDQSPVGRSPRSNPVTYIKAFDQIRSVFADTIEARTRNFTAGHFSFNVDGGRCTKCQGDGQIAIDMQFLADVYIRCPQCAGQRYRSEILKIRYRGRNIAEVLDLTVREAFLFFRGQAKVQARLKRLIDVGLDYLRLGQPANTLSGGEAQRLKLASYISGKRRGRTLFILDEPTTGLHFADIVQLLDCFDALLAVGHSLIVVEHNLQMMKGADYVIDLGPGAADEGGRIGACGTPEEVAEVKNSVTGQYLQAALQLPAAEEAQWA